jgi:hypothetical protein
MDLWMDPKQGTFGLQAEPSFETSDPKAVDFELDSGLKLAVVNKTVVARANTMNRFQQASTASIPPVKLVHGDLPTIRFLPDGSVAETSPQMLQLASSDGGSLWLALSRDGVNYEIRNTEN